MPRGGTSEGGKNNGRGGKKALPFQKEISEGGKEKNKGAAGLRVLMAEGGKKKKGERKRWTHERNHSKAKNKKKRIFSCHIQKFKRGTNAVNRSAGGEGGGRKKGVFTMLPRTKNRKGKR